MKLPVMLMRNVAQGQAPASWGNAEESAARKKVPNVAPSATSKVNVRSCHRLLCAGAEVVAVVVEDDPFIFSDPIRSPLPSSPPRSTGP